MVNRQQRRDREQRAARAERQQQRIEAEQDRRLRDQTAQHHDVLDDGRWE